MYYKGTGTERLSFRPLTVEDIPIWAEFFKDEEATKFLHTWNDETPENRARHMIGKQLDRYKDNRYGLYALVDKTTGDFIGVCGILLQNVEGVDEIEVGYHLMPAHWHKGYATEAARHFRDYAFNNNITSSVISIIDINNFPSQRVAKRNGMKQERSAYVFDGQHYIYRITKEEWESNELHME